MVLAAEILAFLCIATLHITGFSPSRAFKWHITINTILQLIFNLYRYVLYHFKALNEQNSIATQGNIKDSVARTVYYVQFFNPVYF